MVKDMKKILLGLALVLFALSSRAGAAKPTFFFLFIGDGLSYPQRMAAHEFSLRERGEPLAINAMPVHATTRTCSASSLVTDSAAAATALACGTKTRNGVLGLDAEGRRLESVAEKAHKAGKGVGLVTTAPINHATPAGFFGHRMSRHEGYALGLDLLASGFDYFAGGGLSGHNDKASPLYRGDIYDLARKAGYALVREDRAAFDALCPGTNKVWVVATRREMPYAIDAEDWRGVPTLAELTAKGIERLGANPKGFFMMVEGGKIDWAGHANDAATNVREVLAFDEAVRVALDFQKTHPDTLVVVTGDHETGGMTLGCAATGYAFYVERLASQKCSADGLMRIVRDERPSDFAALKPLLASCVGLSDLSPEETRVLDEAFRHDLDAMRKGLKENEAYDAEKITRLPREVKALVSRRCGVGWTSPSHTALPVLTTSQGPGSERFTGLIDNTAIGTGLKDLL